MASFDFPASPNDNDTYSLNGVTYKYVAAKQRWEIVPTPHNFETTAQLDIRDTANRSRSNHTGTQTASTISDLGYAVSANTDVSANTSARHDAVTVVDSSEIDFTLTGQQITASIVAGSIDESKLDASVNASLNLADSALQPWDILETIILLLTPPETNLAVDSDIPAISSFPYNMTITSIRADVDVAPTGSAIVVDMYKNDVTMVDANKFTIAADTTGVVGTLAAGVTGVSAGDKISFSIDQVGATISGQYLTVTINGERA